MAKEVQFLYDKLIRKVGENTIKKIMLPQNIQQNLQRQNDDDGRFDTIFIRKRVSKFHVFCE